MTKFYPRLLALVASPLLIASLMLVAPANAAQTRLAAAGDDDSRALKMSALEALMNAPPERALALLERTLENSDDEKLKQRALFVLSQIDLPAARDRLVRTAAQGDSLSLRREAIRSIGIGGDSKAIESLIAVYQSGDDDIRRAVLQAFLIADEDQLILKIAQEASDDDEFEDAVQVLGAMGATDALATLRNRAPTSKVLIQAYAVADDLDSLELLLNSNTDPQTQSQILRSMGIIGGPKVSEILARQYRSSGDEQVRQAALQGLLVAGDDSAIIELFRSTDSDVRKRELLRLLVVMDSDEVLDLIDSTLSGED